MNKKIRGIKQKQHRIGREKFPKFSFFPIFPYSNAHRYTKFLYLWEFFFFNFYIMNLFQSIFNRISSQSNDFYFFCDDIFYTNAYDMSLLWAYFILQNCSPLKEVCLNTKKKNLNEVFFFFVYKYIRIDCLIVANTGAHVYYWWYTITHGTKCLFCVFFLLK